MALISFMRRFAPALYFQYFIYIWVAIGVMVSHVSLSLITSAGGR